MTMMNKNDPIVSPFFKKVGNKYLVKGQITTKFDK